MHYLPNQCLPAYICLNYNLHWLILSFFLFQMEIFVPSENNYLEWKYLLQMKIFVPNENIFSKWKYFFQMKIFVPNENICSKWKYLFQMKIFVPNKSVCSKRKYLFQMEIFVPNEFIFPKGYIFAPIISCADLFHLYILLTSGLHWNGNIFSQWKTNLHLPHRLAQSPLGVTKPENGILNIKKLLYLGKSKFFLYDPARFFFLSVMRSFL